MTAKDPAFNYDSIAAEYASYVDNAPYNALYERPAMLSLLPDIHGARILDAGCGSGWYAMQLVERGAQVDAIDASPAMVDYARSRLQSVTGDVTLQVADLAQQLPFADDAFDGIVSPLVLHYIRDWRPTLKEMRRVLRPDGWLLFSTHHPAADAARFATKNYFATEHTIDHWDWVGRVEFFRRSLTEIFASINDGGFIIENLVEPVPPEEFRITSPDSWARLMNQPEFLIIVARPAR